MQKFLLANIAISRLASAQQTLPAEWIDPDTGHRVTRLSRVAGTASLYFHQNAYSAHGKKLVVTNPHGIATINLATRQIEQVVEGRVNILVTGHKTGRIYMSKHDYRLEPNVTFSPDMKWIVFRSNMLGPTHVHAVEIAKAR